MAIKSFVLALMFAAAWPHVNAAPSRPSSAAIERIKTELEHIREADQAVRRNFDHSDPEQVGRMLVVDESNRRRLKEIINVIGWPTTELVGENAATGAFLVAQHAADDLDFMKDVFIFIEAGYKKARVAPSHYALMYDRIKMLEGKPQRYGTQFKKNSTGCHAWKMEDPDKVDAYRAGVGLDSLSTYAKKVCGTNP